MKINLVIGMTVLCLWTTAQETIAAENSPAELISPALVNRAGWTWNWQAQLPIRANEAVDRMMVFDDYLYILTDSNLLFCLDRMTGAVRFVTSLSSHKLPAAVI